MVRRGRGALEVDGQQRRADWPRWRDLAERARRAAATLSRNDELGRLGSQAAVWRWPCATPEGALVCALAGEAHAWGRQTDPAVLALLAPNLTCAAETVLELLDRIEAEGAGRAAESNPPVWTRRADIGG